MKNDRLFKSYMLAMGEVFNKQLTPLLHSLYWKALEPFSDEDCERAFKDLIFTSKFFPKPVEFVELLQGKKEDQATRAWIKVVEAVRRIGSYSSVRFDDPVIHSVFKFWGGWGVTATWKDADLKWKGLEFEKLYRVMSAGGNHPEYLPGSHEIENGARGYDAKLGIVEIGGGARLLIGASEEK
ncbi:MAG: hypothetical protein HPY65_00750 [Syntrophaceae bacterium]|nr:hypothetical protein [Syntrophaceae bacterium]